MNKRNIIYLLLLLGTVLLPFSASAQNVIENEEAYLKEFDMNSFADAGTRIKDSTVLYQHLIGVKWGYSMSGVAFSQSNKHKQVKSAENYGIYYTYLHSLLGTMPYFGMQVGIAKTQMGYSHVNEISETEITEEKQEYSAIEVPFLGLFRGDISRVRLMLGIGGFGYYIYDSKLPAGIPETTNKYGFGIMGQGGIAIKLLPVEIHLEAIYKYGLTHFCDPQIYSKDYWLYTHPNQLQISAGLHFNLGGKYSKSKKR